MTVSPRNQHHQRFIPDEILPSSSPRGDGLQYLFDDRDSRSVVVTNSREREDTGVCVGVCCCDDVEEGIEEDIP